MNRWGRYLRILIGVLILNGIAAATGAGAPARATEVPRRVVAFYNTPLEELRFHPLHSLAEMPLNYLGLMLDYHHVDEPLPEDAVNDPSVAGVITWFEQESMPRPAAYLKWADRMVQAGKPYVILGDFGFMGASDGSEPPDRRDVQRFLRHIGFDIGSDWTDVTFDTRIVEEDHDMYGFERQMAGRLPAYEVYHPTAEDTVTHLKVRRRQDGTESHLVMTSPRGGFVESFWSVFKDPVFFRTSWYLNPFMFFRTIFGADALPKPDVTTLSGRRMYFSHIDGDGWRNVSLVEGYREKQAYSAQVVMEKALAPYPDLPVTVGPIGADLDPAWSGTEEAQRLAREIFRLPQVETAHHTHSHPFEWGFFANYTPAKEAPFLKQYKINDPGLWGNAVQRQDAANDAYDLNASYDQPRGFGSQPFSLDKELGGATAFVNQFAPPDKPVRIVLWSGNTSPTPEMIRRSRASGLLNINGGDARFDPEYPSVTYVPPVGRTFGGQVQIFAASSNENTYTDLWTDRFFGFQDLVHTLRNTEEPRRLKPMNIYYHMYSGEKPAALRALRKNLDYARSQVIAPVTASHYAQIAEGFYTTRFETVGPRHWRVLDRGRLQTVRYDHASSLVVDMDTAVGVLGFIHHQDNLYVALDEAVEVPEFRLVPSSPGGITRPMLVDARWHLWNLQREPGRLTMQGQGFGQGEMRWRGMAPGRWRASAELPDGSVVRIDGTVGKNGVLHVIIPTHAYDTVAITLQHLTDE